MKTCWLILLAACALPAFAQAPPTLQPLSTQGEMQDRMRGHAQDAARPAPGVYYGDTSGAMGNVEPAARIAAACDDGSYADPQVHGSVGVGVVGGNHVSGNYQTGAVSVTKNLGDCDNPRGSVQFSIGVGQGHFNGRRWP